LVSGQPGRSFLTEVENLRLQAITPPTGYGVTGAGYSPDGAHIAVVLVDPQQKKAGLIITDNKLGKISTLPPGMQFLRWLGSDEILVKNDDHLVRHSLAGAEDHVFGTPEGWSGPVAAASVIPGTDIQYLTGADGKSGFQRGSEPFHEVLRDAKVVRFGAIANDLSLFGGVDSEKRLWVQHGQDAIPEVVATGVERVIWGPISRRTVVMEANGRSRVYDGRDRSWIDLGVTSAAQWSPDEERLLFIEAGANADSQPYLSLLVDRKIEKLCPLTRIGPMGGAVISEDGEKAFLLAGIGGGLDVWMMSLPPRAAIHDK